MRRRKKLKYTKGTPSAILLSVLIHAGLFLLAGMLVVFTVVKKQEQEFEAPRAVERPKMKLKKPKVRVKKSSRPKRPARITTKSPRAVMPDIQMPGVGGLGDGLGDAVGNDFGLMPGFDEISIFGSGQSIGSDFEGTVYSLHSDFAGRKIPMDEDKFRDILREYVLSGWNNAVLARYYQCPKKLYSTHLMVPRMPTAMAPGYFGRPDLEDYYLFVKYEGQLVYPEDIRIRFWGVGDAYIFVNVDGKEVLLSAWHFHYPWFDWWTTMADGDREYILGNQMMRVGDWIELKAGEALDMKVLFGEWLGGSFAGMLLVEVDGVEYPQSIHNGPLLPAFKTAELSWDTLTQITRFLAAGECSLTNGPIFNDYHDPSTVSTLHKSASPVEADNMEEEPNERISLSASRDWLLTDGRSMNARFITRVGPNAVLETARGHQVRIPLEELSGQDIRVIQLASPPTLDINFSKTTTKRKFGPTHKGEEPPVRGSFYTFATSIKKTSLHPYDQKLTAEYFAIGDEIGGNKRILLEYRKEEFTMTEEDGFTFEFSGEPVELLSYTVNNENRGQRYGGYLAVITDSMGNVIAHRASSKNLFEHVGNPQKLKPGWYFDEECRPCMPTPPRAQTTPGNLN